MQLPELVEPPFPLEPLEPLVPPVPPVPPELVPAELESATVLT